MAGSDTSKAIGRKASSPIREAHDAEQHAQLRDDPGDGDAKLDIGFDESFPSSDAPANAAPGSADPAPSSGYDEHSERKLIARRQRAYALWEREGRPEGRHEQHWHDAGDDDRPEPGTAPSTEGP